jgi:hypothetical protein
MPESTICSVPILHAQNWTFCDTAQPATINGDRDSGDSVTVSRHSRRSIGTAPLRSRHVAMPRRKSAGEQDESEPTSFGAERIAGKSGEGGLGALSSVGLSVNKPRIAWHNLGRHRLPAGFWSSSGPLFDRPHEVSYLVVPLSVPWFQFDLSRWSNQAHIA